METLDLTAFDPILKSHYSKQRIFDLADLKNPFFSMVPKNPKAGGKHYVQPIDFDNPQGGNANLGTAITNYGASKYEDFIITRKKHYQIANIDNETIHASMGNENAFMPALREIDKAFRAAGRSLARKLYRTSGGAIGVVDSTTVLASTSLVLDDAADAFNFQVGMVLKFDDVDGGGPGVHAGSVTVTDIDRENATITVNTNLTPAITGIALGDYIFVEGDYDLCPSGLADWVPAAAPSSTAFYGVDRTTDIDRLGGLRRTANGEPLRESLIKGCATIEKHGGTPSHVFVNPETASDLLLEIDGKVRYDMHTIKGRAKVGFRGAMIVAGNSEVMCIGDVNCPTNKMYILQMDTWMLHSAGSVPMFLNRDGLLQRGGTTDDYECRVGCYFNLGCRAPGYNMVVNL